MVGLAVIGIDGSPGVVHVAAARRRDRLTPAFGVAAIDYPIDPETRRLYADARRSRRLVRRMGGS